MKHVLVSIACFESKKNLLIYRSSHRLKVNIFSVRYAPIDYKFVFVDVLLAVDDIERNIILFILFYLKTFQLSNKSHARETEKY